MSTYTVHFCDSCPLKERKRHVIVIYFGLFHSNIFKFLNSSSWMPLGAMQCSKNWLKLIISEAGEN